MTENFLAFLKTMFLKFQLNKNNKNNKLLKKKKKTHLFLKN